MKLTDALIGEHGAFNALFSKINDLAETGGELSQIESIITVLAAEIEMHASLEEKLIFPALKNLPAADKLLAEMRVEHDEILRALERIEDARDISDALELIQQAMDIVRRHFQKEESIVYPMTRRLLSDEKLSQLADAWATARQVHIE